MNTYNHPDFNELLTNEENQYCFDCGKKNVQWASVNISIFLCTKCAGQHREMGLKISNVRSLTMDVWNEDHIKMLRAGGNKRLNDLLISYDIDRKTDLKIIYQSKLLDYYKNLLKREIYKETIPVKPDIKIALEPYKEEVTNTNQTTNQTATTSTNSTVADNKFGSISSDLNQNESEEGEGFSSYLYSWMGTAYDTSKNIASTVKDKLNDTTIGSKIIDTGSKIGSTTVDILRGTGKTIYEKSSELANTEAVSTLSSKASQGFDYIFGAIYGEKKPKQNTENPFQK